MNMNKEIIDFHIKSAEQKREEQKRESWIKNVMRIYPEKTRKETEELWERVLNPPVK